MEETLYAAAAQSVVDEILTQKEVAKLFKVSTDTIARMMKEQELPYRLFGKRPRFIRRELEEWLSQTRRENVSDFFLKN